MMLFWLLLGFASAQEPSLRVPKLEQQVHVDGDLGEWKRYAFTDGVWDIERLRRAPWYDPAINRLTSHGNEPAPEDDLSARYYIAWDERFLYLGAEVRDNVNDVTDPAHQPKRWYYKDSICWFMEAPRTASGKKFGEGDNAFCFVIDATRPPYAAWWRHGAPGKTYVEEPLPRDAVQYAIRMTRPGAGDFVLEARVALQPTLGVSSPTWGAPRVGDVYGLEIVHCDPDGGNYGGHFLIYGRGDDDSTWGRMELTGPQAPVERKPQ
ncbi:MAG: hypothetical protein JNL62_26900 [Bryobacterales bacterium]|nr:hypothetical protein [Bryobacterales bacterium]